MNGSHFYIFLTFWQLNFFFKFGMMAVCTNVCNRFFNWLVLLLQRAFEPLLHKRSFILNDLCQWHMMPFYRTIKMASGPLDVFFETVEFSLNIFIEANSVTNNKGFEPATSCIRDQDGSTEPARHSWGTRSLNLLPIYATVIYQIPRIRWIHWISVPSRKNSCARAAFPGELNMSGGLRNCNLLH